MRPLHDRTFIVQITLAIVQASSCFNVKASDLAKSGTLAEETEVCR